MSESTSAAPASGRVTLRAFWADLPPAGRWLLSTTAIQTLGRGMVLPFTIVYLTEVRQVPLDTAGVLMGLIAVVAFAVTGPSGTLTDRIGPRHILVWAGVASMVAPLLMGFGTSIPWFLASIVTMGFGWGVAWAAWNTLIASVVSGPARQQFYGLNFALVNLGIGVGGIVSGLFVDVHRPSTFTTIFVIDALCMVVPVGLLLGPLRREGGPVPVPEHHDGAASYLELLRIPAVWWLAGLTFITTFVGYGQMESGFPAFVRQVADGSTRTLGFAFAANTAIIVALQFAVLQRIDGHRRTRILVVMSAIWAIAWLTLALTGWAPGGWRAAAGALAFAAIFGFGETMMQATIPAIVNDLADDHTRGRANSVNSAAFQLGAIAGPVLAGVLLHGGHWVAFISVLVLGCGVVAVSALGIERLVTPEVNGVHTAPPAPLRASDQAGDSMPQVPVQD